MGPDYVRSMCHDIEDPTFDATAVATNPRAQVRPVHRPPRTTADQRPDRSPHCAWTVVIDESHEPVGFSEGCLDAAVVPRRLAGAGPDRPVLARPLRLLRPAGVRPRLRGVLPLGAGPDRRRGVPADAPALPRLPAGRLRAPARRRGARDLREAADRDRRGGGLAAAPRSRSDRRPRRRPPGAGAAPAVEPRRPTSRSTGGRWPRPRPTRTAPGSRWSARRRCVRCRRSSQAVDPHLDVVVSGSPTAGRSRSSYAPEPRRRSSEVAVTRISTGAAFTFEPRRSFPITPV